MRELKVISALLLSVLPLVSCTVKEDREDCPCYLSIGVYRDEGVFREDGNGWLTLWETGGAEQGRHDLRLLDRRDTVVLHSVYPRRRLTGTVTNHPVDGGAVAVLPGMQMSDLYTYSAEMACNVSDLNADFLEKDKQFCTLTLQLKESSMEYADMLEVTVKAPYNGIYVPSMKAHPGNFEYTMTFDAKGQCSVRVPRQGGPGLSAVISMGDQYTAPYDLYRLTTSAHYDWGAWSLLDIKVEVGLNSTETRFSVTDWKVVMIGDREF